VLAKLERRAWETSGITMLSPLVSLEFIRLALGVSRGGDALAGSNGQLSSSSVDDVSTEGVESLGTLFCQACAKVASAGAGRSDVLIALLFLGLGLALERSTVRNSGAVLVTTCC
jgi:hypothetical protein